MKNISWTMWCGHDCSLISHIGFEHSISAIGIIGDNNISGVGTDDRRIPDTQWHVSVLGIGPFYGVHTPKSSRVGHIG